MSSYAARTSSQGAAWDLGQAEMWARGGGGTRSMSLTLEDPRAKVQGSRDPLGVQPIWSRFGRHAVANLTAVTTSDRGFTVFLLGRYFAQRLIEEGAAREHEALPMFLRMEQLCAYARHVGHGVEQDIRGIDRVRRFLAESGSRVMTDNCFENKGSRHPCGLT